MTGARPVEILRPGPEAWAEVREIRLRALRTDPAAFGSTLAREEPWPPDVWRDRLSDRRTFLARHGGADGAVVGVVAFYDEGRPHERQLVSMWVAPGARGCGVGRMLVAAVRRAAEEEGARVLTLFVADGNDAARRFYERLGFTSTGERQPLPSDPALGEERYAVDLGGQSTPLPAARANVHVSAGGPPPCGSVPRHSS